MPRFRNLTKAQNEAFERIACSMEPACSGRTITALLDAGLILESRRTIGRDALGPIQICEYSVPIPIHMEWCEWCLEQLDESAIPAF